MLTGFVERMRKKVATVVERLDIGAAQRLAVIMPGFLRALEADDADVVRLIVDLLPRSPEEIVGLIEQHIDAIERRFAS